MTEQKIKPIILEEQLRDSYIRVLYSQRTHEICTDILLAKLYHIKIGRIVLSTLTTVGFLTEVFGNTHIAKILGMIFSMMLLSINAYSKDYDLSKLAEDHKKTANDLWLIREELLSLLAQLASLDESDTELISKLIQKKERFTSDLHKIYLSAPRTDIKAYKKAQNKLHRIKDNVYTDEEIDKILPKSLKKQKKNLSNPL